MKKIKIYFALSVMVNVLCLVGGFLLFFNPLGLTMQENTMFTHLGFTTFIAMFVLLPTVVVLLLWGLWFRFINKLRNKFLVMGIGLCILSLMTTGVLVQIQNKRTECGGDTGISCQNPI